MNSTKNVEADEPETRLNIVEAINRTLYQEMKRDESVRMVGYDVGYIGGVYRATQGLVEEFGEKRVIDMPLSENGVIGSAVGMAMNGARPVAEIQFLGFFYPAFGQFMYSLVKMHHRSNGEINIPVTVRAPYGGGIRATEYHSESTESYFVHTPGVRVVCPSTPYETKGLLAASIRSEDPVLFLEPKAIYRGAREIVPEEPFTLPLNQARVVTPGDDVSLITWGAMLRHAQAATERVNADVEIVDLRSLSPLDVETILKSVQKTGRCVVLHEGRRTLGLGAEISALVNEHALDRLKAPIKRASGFDVHVPLGNLEDQYLPDAERAEHAINAVMNYQY